MNHLYLIESISCKPAINIINHSRRIYTYYFKGVYRRATMPKGIQITGIKADGSFSYQVVADTTAVDPTWEPPPMLNIGGGNSEWSEREAFAQKEMARILSSDWQALNEHDRDNKGQMKKLMEAWVPQLEVQERNLQQQLKQVATQQEMNAIRMLIQKMQRSPDSVTDAEENMLDILRKNKATLTSEEQAKRAQYLNPLITQASAPLLKQIESIQEKIKNVKTQIEAIPPEPPRDPLAKMRVEIIGLHNDGKPQYMLYNGKDTVPPPLNLFDKAAWEQRDQLAQQLIARSPEAQQKIQELQSALKQRVEQGNKVSTPSVDRDAKELQSLLLTAVRNDKEEVILDILSDKRNGKAQPEDLKVLDLHYKVKDGKATPDDKAAYEQALDKRIYAGEQKVDVPRQQGPKQVQSVEKTAQYEQIQPSEWAARQKLDKIDINALYLKERGQTGKGFFKALTMRSGSRSEQIEALQKACDKFVQASQATLYTPDAVDAARELFKTLDKIKGSIEGEKKRLGASGMSQVCSELEKSLSGIRKDLERPEIKALQSLTQSVQENVSRNKSKNK